MYKINPHNSWLALEARAADEDNPRRKGLLLEVRDHMEAEINGRLEPLMATLTGEPIYHFWGTGPAMVIDGRQAVNDFYAGMFTTGGQQFEVVVDRIVVDDNAVVTEGQVKNVATGAGMIAQGVTEANGEPITEDDLFVTTAQLVTVWAGRPGGQADRRGHLLRHERRRVDREDHAGTTCRPTTCSAAKIGVRPLKGSDPVYLTHAARCRPTRQRARRAP